MVRGLVVAVFHPPPHGRTVTFHGLPHVCRNKTVSTKTGATCGRGDNKFGCGESSERKRPAHNSHRTPIFLPRCSGAYYRNLPVGEAGLPCRPLFFYVHMFPLFLGRRYLIQGPRQCSVLNSFPSLSYGVFTLASSGSGFRMSKLLPEERPAYRLP